MASRKVRFDPVAKPNQRPPWTCEGGGDARAQRHRPIVAECLLPDKHNVSIRRTGNFDLIQRCAGSENPAEDLLDPRFMATRVDREILDAGEVLLAQVPNPSRTPARSSPRPP